MAEQTEYHLLKMVLAELSWARFVLVRKIKSRLLWGKRLLIRPKLPYNPDGKIFIHLGCGDIASPEFINVDARSAPHVHYVRDVCDLSIFPDNYADLVYACHILEHIVPEKLVKVLWEWKRILKVGGILRISVPDFDKLLAVYEACDRDSESIRVLLMGYWDGYNPHCMIFNYKYLSKMLCDVGFGDICKWAPQKVDHHNFEDWASRCILRRGKEFHISLNVEAVKQN